MFKRVFVFLALTFALFGTQCWAGTCSSEDSNFCTYTFFPGNTTAIYDFSSTGDGILTVQFTTVLRMFKLTVTVKPFNNMLDPNVFPTGTVAVQYSNLNFDQYDFTGDVVGSPNGVPVRKSEFNGVIDVTLSFTGQVFHDPAFGHAPGESTIFSVNFIDFYSTPPPSIDPGTIHGKLPGLSSVVALDEPSETGTFCFVSPTPLQIFSAAQVDEIEVAFQLSSDVTGSCPITGKPLRDKTARLSLALTDINGKFISLATIQDKEEGNKFHWDSKERTNEFDLSTEGLAPGNYYTITVFSKEFGPPQSVTFFLAP